jgi:uncharacterized membrane protein
MNWHLLYYFIPPVALWHATIGLWCHFAAVMRLKMLRDAGTLTTAEKVFGYYVAVRGLLIDFVYQVIVGSILFLELPREGTLSTRLWRLSTRGTGWRQRLALAIRTQLLDSVDPAGVHTG